MHLNLVDSSGSRIDYADVYVDLQRYYGDRSFILEGLSNAFDVTVDNFDRMVDESCVTERALIELIELSSFSVEYKSSDDDRYKKFHRLMSYANGLTCGRISRDDGFSTFNGFTREIQRVWNILLGICFKRGLNEEAETTVRFVNNKCNANYISFDENDAQMLVCSAPRIEIVVSYDDSDIDETMTEPIDIAVLSCTTVEAEQRVSFKPERFEFDKEEMQRYLRIAFPIFFQKYVERGGLKIRDTVIQSALIDSLWRHFEQYVGSERTEHNTRRRRRGNFYCFTLNEQSAQVATEVAAEV